MPLTAALKACLQAISPQRDPERSQTLVADLLAQRQLIDCPTHGFAKGSRPLATDGAVIIKHRMLPRLLWGPLFYFGFWLSEL